MFTCLSGNNIDINKEHLSRREKYESIRILSRHGTFVIGRHFSFLLSLAFPTSAEFNCVSFCCAEQLSFCVALSACCCVSSVILTHDTTFRDFRNESSRFLRSETEDIYTKSIYNLAFSEHTRREFLLTFTRSPPS